MGAISTAKAKKPQKGRGHHNMAKTRQGRNSNSDREWCGVQDATGMQDACLARRRLIKLGWALRAAGGQRDAAQVIWHPREQGG